MRICFNIYQVGLCSLFCVEYTNFDKNIFRGFNYNVSSFNYKESP